ncbi:MAG: hypothetical protein J5722_06355 [Oscillospiraceae bacterium]|nr:hypothetical protein [Oscillospiraceae bacterium]
MSIQIQRFRPVFTAIIAIMRENSAPVGTGAAGIVRLGFILLQDPVQQQKIGLSRTAAAAVRQKEKGGKKRLPGLLFPA